MFLTTLVKVLVVCSSLFFSFFPFLLSQPTYYSAYSFMASISFFFPNSLLTLHSRRLACKWVWFRFSLRRRVSCNNGCCCFWGKGKVTTFSPPCIYIPYKCAGAFGVVPLCPYSSLGNPRIGFPPSQVLSRVGRFVPLDFV